LPYVTRAIFSGWVMIGGAVFAGAEPLQVSALHPLMADLARQVGGARVEVHDLAGEGGNPHRFEPRPTDMKRMQASAVVLACGKNLEPYLGRLKSGLSGVTVIEVGRTIPSLTVGKDAVCPGCSSHGEHAEHGAGLLDPHWWHGVDNMRRAARVVAKAFAEKDPAGEAYFMEHANAYGRRMDDLKRWAAGELGKIPRAQRILVTAHNAFGYFAREFGFAVIAVAGLNQEQNTTPQEHAKTLEAVKKSGVRAVFPEPSTSGKVLDSLASTLGVRLGTPLIADGNGTGKDAGFEAMIRHNVTSITQALTAP
jgi:zinc/manganese transport system substrate-binding protein